MLKRWTRIWSILVFVFATIASPLHAHNMPSMIVASMATTHAAVSQAMPGMPGADMPGMSGDTACKHSDAAAVSKGSQPAHAQDCCSDGCQCPLSHCPASPALLALFQQPVIFSVTNAGVGLPAEAKLPEQWIDRLKRPPRT